MQGYMSDLLDNASYAQNCTFSFSSLQLCWFWAPKRSLVQFLEVSGCMEFYKKI
jgi:hypothetical protein